MQEFGHIITDDDASGVRPGGEDQRAANVPVGENQPLVRGHPESSTGQDANHCASCRKYFQRKAQKHSMTAQLVNFFNNEPSKFIFICVS